MATRQELLDYLWKEVINVHLRDEALDNIVPEAARDQSSHFFIGQTHGTRFPDPIGPVAASLV